MKAKPTIFLSAVMAATLISSVAAAENAPYDFSYRATGSTPPTLIFNDGSDVYIQAGQDTVVTSRVMWTREGPYIVIRGLEREFNLRSKKGVSRVTYEPPVTRQAAEPVAAPKATVFPAQATPDVAKVAVAATPIADGTSCLPVKEFSKSATAVTFAGGATRLSKSATEKLTAHLRAAGRIDQVEITTPSGASASKNEARANYLRKLIAGQGVDAAHIQVASAPTYKGMTEVTMRAVTIKPCAQEASIVSVSDGYVSVIASRADAEPLIREIGEKSNRPLRTEGIRKELPVTVKFASEPMSDAMARIARSMGSSADLILRDTEIVLRYHN